MDNLPEATPPTPPRQVREDPWYVRVPLIVVAVGFMVVMVAAPLLNVFMQALSRGAAVAWQAVSDPDTIDAAKLTLTVTVLAVLLNLVFGLCAAWLLARFRFRGKALLTALIDLPLSISPVVAGLMFVLLFGLNGWFGPWLDAHDIEIIFAVPGVVLVTTFVTLPIIARTLTPVLEEVGSEEEQAARTLGAGPWQTFWFVTLPNIRWGLLYAVLLCSARALGEFGAASVVSGRQAGLTDTLPIRVQKLHEGLGPDAAALAFTVASLLAGMALLTLVLKIFLERKRRAILPERGKS
jgi:sulfate transport system permease protein